MTAVAGCTPGHAGAQCRRPTFEIGTRAAHAVAIDHHAGIAIGDVLAVDWRHDRLIVDAGVRHQHAERFERSDRAAFECEHPRLLLEPGCLREIGAARSGDCRYADAAFAFREHDPVFQPFHAGTAERFRIGHDMRLRDRHEIRRAEIAADPDLMLDRPLPQRAEFAAAHRQFFVAQLHDTRFARRVGLSVYCPTMPAALISGTHLSTSLLTSMRSASGERCPGEGMSAPISPSRLAIVGSCIAFCTASLTFDTIAAGVFFGANKAVQATVSSFGSPASLADGTFGMDGARCGMVTTIGFSPPLAICGVAVTTWSNSRSIWPPRRSLVASDRPR